VDQASIDIERRLGSEAVLKLFPPYVEKKRRQRALRQKVLSDDLASITPPNRAAPCRRDNKAIEQAKSGARQVAAMIGRSCCCSGSIWVRPVVVFVGNWVVADQWYSTDVRVFTPKSLKSYVRDQQPVLTKREIDSIASHLERSVTS
jgi:hypothetical protein